MHDWPDRHASTPSELQERLAAERSDAPFVELRDGDGVQRLVTLTEGLTVGRSPACGIALIWDAQVSRSHASIEAVDGVWTVLDDGRSTNGTFVNEERVQGRRTLRHRTPLSLILVDVDFFKRFNDAYGHVAGDHCLLQVAQTLAGNARSAGEMAARYGGEEFAVLLPHTELDDAHRLAQRMCEAVRQLRIPHEQSEVTSHVTISAGVASALLVLAGEAEAERASPTLLIKTADQALYGAKAAGRNQVTSARPGGGGRRTEEWDAADAERSWGEVVRLPLRRSRAP